MNWIYDTGASVTSMTPADAAAAGMLPGLEAGAILLNGIPARCYPNITIVCLDSFGNVCVNTTTVYVPIGGVLATVNLLGRDIRKKFKGRWLDDDETVLWNDPNTPAGPFLMIQPRLDLPSFQLVSVVEGVKIHGNGAQAKLAMTTLSGSNRTFIPAQVASDLGLRVVGSVDLLAKDPTSLLSLYFAGQNNSLQTVFEEVVVSGLELGIGSDVGSFRVLVNQDGNSMFGSLGKDALVSDDGGIFAIHELERTQADLLVYSSRRVDATR